MIENINIGKQVTSYQCHVCKHPVAADKAVIHQGNWHHYSCTPPEEKPAGDTST